MRRTSCGGNEHPPQAPARHLEILREAVDHEHVVARFGRGARVEPVGEAVVDLVGQQRRALLAGERGEPGHLVRRDQRAGRIGRARHHDHARGGAPVVARELRGELVARGHAHGHAARHRAQRAREMPVAGVARIGEEHLVARIEQHAEGEQQRGARARGDDHRGSPAPRRGSAPRRSARSPRATAAGRVPMCRTSAANPARASPPPRPGAACGNPARRSRGAPHRGRAPPPRARASGSPSPRRARCTPCARQCAGVRRRRSWRHYRKCSSRNLCSRLAETGSGVRSSCAKSETRSSSMSQRNSSSLGLRRPASRSAFARAS